MIRSNSRSTLARLRRTLRSWSQESVVKRSDMLQRARLARSEQLLPETQLLLARDEHMWPRAVLATRDDLKAPVQQLLAADEDGHVLYKLAANPDTSVETQLALAKKNFFVRTVLAKNVGLTLEAQLVITDGLDAASAAVVDDHLRENPGRHVLLLPSGAAVGH